MNSTPLQILARRKGGSGNRKRYKDWDNPDIPGNVMLGALMKSGFQQGSATGPFQTLGAAQCMRHHLAGLHLKEKVRNST